MKLMATSAAAAAAIAMCVSQKYMDVSAAYCAMFRIAIVLP
jgi:hypothetical protein